MPRVRSPTAIGLAVAGAVLLVYALLTGGAVIAFAVEAFAVTAALLAPWARGRGDGPPGDDDPPASGPPPSGPGLGHHEEDRDEHEGEDRGLDREQPAEGRVVLGRGRSA